jgi:DNA-binding phage protein
VSRNDLVLFALGMIAAAGALVSVATFVQFARELRRRRAEAT